MVEVDFEFIIQKWRDPYEWRWLAIHGMIQPAITPCYVIWRAHDWAPDQPGPKLEACQAQDSTIENEVEFSRLKIET